MIVIENGLEIFLRGETGGTQLNTGGRLGKRCVVSLTSIIRHGIKGVDIYPYDYHRWNCERTFLMGPTVFFS